VTENRVWSVFQYFTRHTLNCWISCLLIFLTPCGILGDNLSNSRPSVSPCLDSGELVYCSYHNVIRDHLSKCMDCPKCCPNVAFRETPELAVLALSGFEYFMLQRPLLFPRVLLMCNADVLFRDLVNILDYLSVAYSTPKYLFQTSLYFLRMPSSGMFRRNVSPPPSE
jgi:hypothetical protein